MNAVFATQIALPTPATYRPPENNSAGRHIIFSRFPAGFMQNIPVFQNA